MTDTEQVNASYLKPGNVIIVVDGVQLVVREVKSTHKDAVSIHFRGRGPIYCRWNDQITRKKF